MPPVAVAVAVADDVFGDTPGDRGDDGEGERGEGEDADGEETEEEEA